MKGRWSIPGGMVELGESLPAAARRELREETGLDIRTVGVLEVFDRIVRQNRRVRYHYVVVDYACRKVRGRIRPASDVLEARWVRRQDLPRYRLSSKALEVIRRGLEFFEKSGRLSKSG
jgi:8-oxo-dGTP diphosphatase